MAVESILTFLAVLMLLKGLAGALEGLRYHQYIRDYLARRCEPWMPPASVILPCKGIDYDLEGNVTAVLQQVYPFFELLIVTANADDPARSLLEPLAARFPGHRVRFITAGHSDERGEKVHNLIQAVAEADTASEVLVFTDSDSRPHPLWLQELVAPLRDESVGVSTGYRWYFPAPKNFPGLLRSVWNGSVATLLGNHSHNFAWGGSMALRKTTFTRARVLNYWEHSLSDDYSLTQAMKDARLRIHYEPRCLIGSYGSCTWKELVEWSTRQMTITRIYSARLWKLAAISQWSFVLVWWWALLGFALTLGTNLDEVGRGLPALWRASSLKYFSITLLLFFFGAFRGACRIRTVALIHPDKKMDLLRRRWAYVLLFPLTSSLTAYNLFASAFRSSLLWRGVHYEVKSSKELRVLHHDS